MTIPLSTKYGINRTMECTGTSTDSSQARMQLSSTSQSGQLSSCWSQKVCEVTQGSSPIEIAILMCDIYRPAAHFEYSEFRKASSPHSRPRGVSLRFSFDLNWNAAFASVTIAIVSRNGHGRWFKRNPSAGAKDFGSNGDGGNANFTPSAVEHVRGEG